MPARSRYGAMTVNERLFVAGLIEQFDSAAEARDRERLIEILKLVEFTQEEAESIVTGLLADPRQFGF